MKTYNYFQDPGHGWVRVKMSELVELGIADKISSYSYVSASGKSVYLEEDMDLSTFLSAKGIEKLSELPTRTKYSEKSSYIRTLKHYVPPTTL